MMLRKGFFISAVICLLSFMPAYVQADYSVNFSTGGENLSSWTMTVTSGVAVLSFGNNEIDTSYPTPDPVLDDLIDLPSMTLTNLATYNIGGFDLITATLIPDGSDLTIRADVASGSVMAGQTVMSAAVATGGFLTVGKNFIAYSNEADDLDMTNSVAGYSVVIDEFAWADGQGINLDLSFSGDTAQALFNLLDTMDDGSVSGVLSGQIVAVPEPVTLSLLALGGLSLLRRRGT
jgi:hypothetical protein